MEENRSVEGKKWKMKSSFLEGDLRTVSLVTAQPKWRNRPEGGRKTDTGKSLIILITLTLCPEHFSVSIPVAEPEDLYRFWAMQKYLIFGMINEVEHDQVSYHSFEPLSFA